MKQVIGSEALPIKLWLDDMEKGALEQARNLANLPFAFKCVAIMPDSHQGYGLPIGGVLATKGVIIPNAMGVDIGCGMCAVQTSRVSDHHGRRFMKRAHKTSAASKSNASTSVSGAEVRRRPGPAHPTFQWHTEPWGLPRRFS